MFWFWSAGLFYTLPVVQLVFYHQNTMVTTGNQVTGSSNNYLYSMERSSIFCCFSPKLYVQIKIPTVSVMFGLIEVKFFFNVPASNCIKKLCVRNLAHFQLDNFCITYLLLMQRFVYVMKYTDKKEN
jgi:hypothetical protein